MKIGVNARFLTKPYTGIGQHTRYLFQTLAKQNPKDHFVLISHEKVDLPMPENVELCVVPEKFPGTPGMRKTYWEQWQLPRFFLQKKVDLIHFPYPSNPWRILQFISKAALNSTPAICVTVHDTIPWTMPAYRRSLLTRLYQDRCRAAVKKADHVFTVSMASKMEIEKLCDVAPQKISMSYNAPAPHFFKKVSAPSIKQTLEKYGLQPARPYLFYIGGYDERKNVRVLLKVFQEKIAPHYPVDLVLAGGKSINNDLYQSFDELTNKHHGRSLKLVPIGFVEEEDLPALYQSSVAFISLSLKEGCNLPLLEAAVSKTPTIASDLPVHHEMVDKVAIFTSPTNEDDFEKTLIKLLTDKNFYQKQKKKLEDFVCHFSWEKTAREVMEVYKKLL